MMRRWVVLNGILAVILLGLVVQIARTWARSLPPAEMSSAAAKGIDLPARGEGGGKKSKRAAAAEKTAQTPQTFVTAIVAKDLFDPSRTKPAEDAKPVVASHEPPPTGITLTGVRIFGKDREGFIIDSSQANAQRRIRIGDPVGNFTVKEIHTSHVLIVSQAGDEVKLTLELDKSKGGGAGAPPTTTTPRRPPMPGAASPGATAGAASPAAGVVSGTPAAAGVGGHAATPGAPPPGVPVGGSPGVVPTPSAVPGRATASQIPQLPAGVREKIEQMKKDRAK